MGKTPRRQPVPSNLFSFSRLKAYSQCPLRYRYRYLKGMKEAFKSIEAFLGSVVHEVLEWMYRRRSEGAPPALDEVLDELARRWQASWTDDIAIVRLGVSADDVYRQGREMLTGFFHNVFLSDRSTTIALEQRMSARISEDVTFTGFADRVGRTEQGRLFVVDYKTSSREGDASDFSEGLQAPLYAVSAMDHNGDATCLAGYHYLRFGSTNWREVDRKTGEVLQNRFRRLAEEALAATEFPAKPGILCAWCGFNRICPAAEVPESLSGGRFPVARQ